MSINIGINGFGRIGRMVLRAGINNPNIRFVAINDLVPAENLAYLMKYDSTHGRFPGNVETDGNNILIDGKSIECVSERDPEQLGWGDKGVDYVIESTGLFTTLEKAELHLKAGAKKVVISAPAKSKEISTFVMGVNHETYQPSSDQVVSNASCTTNCLAPVVKVLLDNFGIEEGLMTTIHAVTATQPTVDGPSKKDFRGGRGGFQNIIPASTGAAKAVGLCIPEVQGKLTGMAMRVPTANVSVVDLKCVVKKSTSIEEINEAMIAAANEGPLKGVLDTTDQPLVSIDLNHDPHSAVVPLDQTKVMGQRFCRVMAWYDNEWGFSVRMLDTAAAMGKCL